MKHQLCKILLFTTVLVSPTFPQANFWQQMSAPYNGDVRSMAFTNSSVIVAGTYGGGVWRSTNDGQSWSISNSGLSSYYVYALARDSLGRIIAGAGSGLYRSTDQGLTWVALISGCECEFWALAASHVQQPSGTIFAGTTGGVSRSTDDGATWSSFQILMPILSLSVDPNGIVYAASTDSGVYRSTNSGANWARTTLSTGSFVSLATNMSGHVFAATYANIYRTLDRGTTWQQSSIPNADVRSVAVAPNGHLFAAANPGGVYRSTDNGANWDSINTGLTNRYGTLLGINPAGYVFAVAGARLFRSVGPVTTIQWFYSSIPASPRLEQNYPNPFNPSTTIKFHIATASHVSLKVFDVLGREVAQLVNEQLSAGAHSTDWNATGFASGVYYYELQAGDFIQARKLVLLR